MRIKQLKLAQSSARKLQEKEMKVLVGGYKCGCGCGSFSWGDNTGGSAQSNYDSN